MTEAPAAHERYPRAAALVSRLLQRSSPVLREPVRYQIEQRGDDFWREAERLVALSEELGGSPLEALLEYTVAILREQARFAITGRYTHEHFETAFEEVYDNAEVMEGYYLHGLLLTHAFWPIHFDIHRFFEREFLTRVADGGIGSEIGYGHGLYLLDLLRAKPTCRTTSFDVSRYAQRFAAHLLEAGGVDPQRFALEIGDVRARLLLPDGESDWLILAEILEHLPDPAAAMAEMRRCAAPSCPLFVTTVVDSNAMDHLYQFEHVDEIRRLIAAGGFEIAAEQILRVTDSAPASDDPTIDAAFVCLPSD